MNFSITASLANFRVLTRTLGGALLLIAPLAGTAATVHLVRNINTTLIPQSSFPAALGSLNGKLLFGATDATGPGLWTTNGTAAGTQLLQRLTGLGILANSPWNNFIAVGSRAYFVSSDGNGTSSVWLTDGTAGGTSRVMAFPGDSTATVNLEGLLGAMLILSTDDLNGNAQMYETDGTAAGTHQLTAFTGQNAGVLNGFIIAGSKFYFVAEDTSYNHQIWVSDGTAAGTHQVANGLGGSVGLSAAYNPQGFQVVGSLVLYGSSGLLWSIDTATDTVANVVTSGATPGFGPPYVQSVPFANMGSFILFLGDANLAGPASLELWRSDGTAAGTYEVASVSANPTSNELQYPVFEQVGNKVVYVGDDGINGPQLWSSDGTSANTIRLTSATDTLQDPYPIAAPMSVIGGTAYFHISNGTGTTTRSVWRTDGTVAGTQRLGGLPSIAISEAGVTSFSGDANTAYFGLIDATDETVSIYKYLPASNLAGLAEAGLSFTFNEFFEASGLLFFAPNDYVVGVEPWVSNGTAAGTHLIEDINPQKADNGSAPDEFVNFGGLLAFAADDGVAGRELWISDGTTAGTKLLADINPGAASSNPNHLFTVNGVLYFFATDATGASKFMRLAGVGATIQTLAVLSPQPTAGTSSCGEDGAVAIGTQVYFAANNGVSGLELWTSDGTAQGTHLAADIAAGTADSYPCYLTAMSGRVYFSAVGPLGNEMWSSDGSSAGTVQVADIAPGVASSNPSGLSLFKSSLFFAADDTVHGSELWASNGSGVGTTLVADIVPGSTGSFPYPVGALNGRLLLQAFVTAANSPVYSMQLWSTDGTTSGTTQVSAATFPTAVNPLINGSQAFFVGQDASGVEPWVTDGTAGGTHILKDINPTGSSNPTWFESFLGTTVFEVTDPTLGEQLWRTDGTAAGTTLVSAIPALDVTPTPSTATSARHRLTVGSSFYFAATDPTVGTELYAMTNAAPVAAADSADSNDDAAVTIDVLANDTDSDGTLDPASIAITTNPMHGAAAVTSGKIVYTPSTGFSGTDTFAYTVKDNQGMTSAPAIVTVTVTARAASIPTPPHGGGGAITFVPLFALMLLWASRLRRPGSIRLNG